MDIDTGRAAAQAEAEAGASAAEGDDVGLEWLPHILIARCVTIFPCLRCPPFLPLHFPQALTDQDFLGSILSTLPGVDPNDAQIQELLRNYNPTGTSEESKDSKDKEKK